jgi:hypothetical protein
MDITPVVNTPFVGVVALHDDYALCYFDFPGGITHRQSPQYIS